MIFKQVSVVKRQLHVWKLDAIKMTVNLPETNVTSKNKQLRERQILMSLSKFDGSQITGIQLKE